MSQQAALKSREAPQFEIWTHFHVFVCMMAFSYHKNTHRTYLTVHFVRSLIVESHSQVYGGLVARPDLPTQRVGIGRAGNETAPLMNTKP